MTSTFQLMGSRSFAWRTRGTERASRQGLMSAPMRTTQQLTMFGDYFQRPPCGDTQSAEPAIGAAQLFTNTVVRQYLLFYFSLASAGQLR